MNEYVGKFPFGFVSVSGCVMTPVPTFPEGVERVIVGTEIAPASLTPIIVPVTSMEPPTRSDDFITPSMVVVATFAFMFNVEELSCPPLTENSPKVCAWKSPDTEIPPSVQVQWLVPLSSIYVPLAVMVGACPADVFIEIPPNATFFASIVLTLPRVTDASVASDVAM